MIQSSTSSAKRASDSIGPTSSSPSGQPAALKSSRHRFEELQAAGRKLESIE
jgi:hypothetical protein